ncbi:MAG TPA: substrate-binding domain-containing protein [Rugosimonospora sp.]|nr:substrate-binding domain-containing protein [Rugosimonospora sp.]
MDGTARSAGVARQVAPWLAALLTVVLVVVGAVVGIDMALGGECAHTVTVTVAANPGVADAVAQAGRELVDPASCVQIEVLARDSAGVADMLANPPVQGLPDVWVPESTFWLRRARSLGADDLPAQGVAVAYSPVVLGVTRPVATRLGWPATPVSWSALLGPAAPPVPVAVPDPASDPVGVATLLAVRGITAGTADAGGADVAVLRRVSADTTTRAADLFTQVAGSVSGPGASLSAMVCGEQALISFDRRQPAGAQLIAGYPDQALPGLDYPYTILPTATPAVRAAAIRFQNILKSVAGQRVLGAAGFRTPDGSPPTDLPADLGLRDLQLAPVALPSDDALLGLLNTWTGVHLSARILGLIDVSAAMGTPIPGTGDTRLSATIAAAQQGAGLLMDSTQVSVWTFAAQLDPPRDYRTVLGYQGLGYGGRALLADVLGQVRVQPGSRTALYDTMLAAYQQARRDWTPGQINLVLVATDGDADNSSSITRAQLISRLRALQDPRRPLPILFIGLHGGIDPRPLQDIAGATGGRVYITATPDGIRQVFFDALATLTCQPPACRPPGTPPATG